MNGFSTKTIPVAAALALSCSSATAARAQAAAANPEWREVSCRFSMRSGGQSVLFPFDGRRLSRA